MNYISNQMYVFMKFDNFHCYFNKSINLAMSILFSMEKEEQSNLTKHYLTPVD